MVKMAKFLKRKHFSLWIIRTFIALFLASQSVHVTFALQGVPTWICLGVKSPFIEFRNEQEVLANNSIPLNITKDEQAFKHQEGLRKLGKFIKPVDLRDSETGFVKADLTKKIPSKPPGIQMHRRLHPIQEEMDQKQIILLDEETDENGLPASLTEEDRRFIVPMALKNPLPEPRAQVAPQRAYVPTTTTTKRPSTTTTTTKKRFITTPATPEFASNIDDLKKHILFLQNLTKHDSNFQSKFVVFPSLQKDKSKTDATQPTTTTTRPIFQYSGPLMPPPPRKVPVGAHTPGSQPFGGYYHNEDEDSMSAFVAQQNGINAVANANTNTRDKIAIVPQVLLLNDNHLNRPALDATTTTTTTSTTPPTTTTSQPKRPTKLPACVRNPESPKCVKQRKREELQRQRERERLLREQREFLPPRYEPVLQTLNNTKRFAVSIEIPDSFKYPYNESIGEMVSAAPVEQSLQILSRVVRSQHKRRNIGGGLPGRSGSNDKFSSKYSMWLDRDAVVQTGGRDFLLPPGEDHMGLMNNGTTPSPTVAAYTEPIDLNPDHCYEVDGMSYGQKKQCVLHTSVMPAISRGARAAIQECQYQFGNRRWNCSTTDDNTVFGPMSSLGSPEMAFIHALAAATVTSFIARACRDGQLASCGCSRGSRPKQLHDDWTWGGCGDNLEYAYKFATDFIDVREKETKRGTRGVGNPERKRGRLHQRRNHHQQQQQQKQQQQLKLQQRMQADDASAAMTFTNVNVTTTTTTSRTILNNNKQSEHDSTGNSQSLKASASRTATATTAERNLDVNNQQNSNKTVSNDANNNNNSSYSNTNNSMLPAMTSSSKDETLAGAASASAASSAAAAASTTGIRQAIKASSVAPPKQEDSSEEDDSTIGRIKPEDLFELQERITKEILNSKLQEKEMLELKEKINRELLNSKVFNMEGNKRKRKRKNQRAVNGNGNGNGNAGANSNPMDEPYNNGNMAAGGGTAGNKWKHIAGIGSAAMTKARSLMNLHNNEAGRRAVIKKTRITCKCHGVSGSCSLITCWQQLSSIREIGDYLREKYEEATEVKLNKRGRLQVKDPQFKVPTAHDLVYLDDSPDWCRSNRQLQWPGTHGRVCNKTSSGLDGCGILCCGRGYNTKNIVVRERCNCKFHWCCQVKCDVCVKVIEEHTCK